MAKNLIKKENLAVFHVQNKFYSLFQGNHEVSEKSAKEKRHGQEEGQEHGDSLTKLSCL